MGVNAYVNSQKILNKTLKNHEPKNQIKYRETQ